MENSIIVTDLDRLNVLNRTRQHVIGVQKAMALIVNELIERSIFHDNSKFINPELDAYAEFGPQLSKTKFGTKDYYAIKEKMGEALIHHYQNNTHHPQHFENKMDGMNLFDIIEMLTDWMSIINIRPDGNLLNSLEINNKDEDFGMSTQLYNILKNTIEYINETKNG